MRVSDADKFGIALYFLFYSFNIYFEIILKLQVKNAHFATERPGCFEVSAIVGADNHQMVIRPQH